MNVLHSLFVRYSWKGVRESSAPLVYHHDSTGHQHHGGLQARSGKISQCQNGTWTIKMMQAPVSSTATTAALDTLQEVGSDRVRPKAFASVAGITVSLPTHPGKK
jgi:hypothetical protein